MLSLFVTQFRVYFDWSTLSESVFFPNRLSTFFLLLHLRTVCRLRLSAGANLLLSQADREDKLYESLVYSRMDRVYQTPQRVSRGGRKDEAEKLESFVQASDNPVICLSEASHTSDLKAKNVKLLLHPFSLARSLTHSDFPSAFFVAALDVFSLERLSISLFISRLLKINKTTEDAHVLGFFLPPSRFSKLGFDRRHATFSLSRGAFLSLLVGLNLSSSASVM